MPASIKQRKIQWVLLTLVRSHAIGEQGSYIRIRWKFSWLICVFVLGSGARIMGLELQSSEEKASAQLLHRRKPLRLYFKKMLRVSVPRKPSPCPEWHSPGLLNSWVLAGWSSSSAQSYTPMCIVSALASQYFYSIVSVHF